MSNFEYIIASLPYLTPGYHYAEGKGFQDVLGEIRRDLSARDNATLDFLLKGFDADSLDAPFYEEALHGGNRFLREYFRFDLNLRNAKVRYLNRQLARDAEQDVLGIDGGEFTEAAKVESVLAEADLIAREKGLDDLTWAKVDALSTFHYFDLTAVLAYVTKLHIADRWLALDEARGRELFRKLVDEVRGTFKGVQFNEQ
ncbi:MAG: DUF2764 family protein [Bacteroidales bacterium]|nr:DUF2764 family protein [Bacteroidales bacterium]